MYIKIPTMYAKNAKSDQNGRYINFAAKLKDGGYITCIYWFPKDANASKLNIFTPSIIHNVEGYIKENNFNGRKNHEIQIVNFESIEKDESSVKKVESEMTGLEMI